jgi:hypothetical protein
MAFGRKTGGRKPGSKNKTASVIAMREAVWEAFVQLGDVKGLVKWAKENPTEFYKLAGRLMPTVDASTTHDGDINILITGDDARRDIIGRLAPRLAGNGASRDHSESIQ